MTTAAPPSPHARAHPAITAAIDQFQQYKKDYPDAILFFRFGDFYETFYDDAKTVSRTLGTTLTTRMDGSNSIPMAGIPVHAVESYLQRMVAAGFKVALCEQKEPAKETPVSPAAHAKEWITCLRCGARRLKKNTRDGFCHRPAGNCYWDNQREQDIKRQQEKAATEKAERHNTVFGAIKGIQGGSTYTETKDGRRLYLSIHRSGGHKAISSADGEKTHLHLKELSPEQVKAICAIVEQEIIHSEQVEVIGQVMESHFSRDDVEVITKILSGEIDATEVKNITDARDATSLDAEQITALHDAGKILHSIQHPSIDEIFLSAGRDNMAMRMIAWKAEDAMRSIREVFK